ncbi:hypothetical protein CCP4SC76_3830002 [Gammaproteobacteria bacterium]
MDSQNSDRDCRGGGDSRQPGSGLHAADPAGTGFGREDAWGEGFAAWLVSGVFDETVDSQGLGGAKGYDDGEGVKHPALN